jgi:hypothetical protein
MNHSAESLLSIRKPCILQAADLNTVPNADARKPLSRRKSVRTACILLVICIIVIAALWWYAVMMGPFIGAPQPLPDVELQVESADGNWTCTITKVREVLLLDDVLMTMYDDHGRVKEPISLVKLSALTAANWDVNKILYHPIGGENTIVVGATIIIDKTVYPSGYHFLLQSPTAQHGSGSLK